MCYTRWRKSRLETAEDKRDELDQQLIQDGLLLPARQGRRPSTPNPFAEYAERLRQHAKQAARELERIGKRKK